MPNNSIDKPGMPKPESGAALDIDSVNMPQDGVVEIKDDDNNILDADEADGACTSTPRS